MTTSAPFDEAIAEMNATMDEMERVLEKGKGKDKGKGKAGAGPEPR
jgi:hypothetical protein